MSDGSSEMTVGYCPYGWLQNGMNWDWDNAPRLNLSVVAVDELGEAKLLQHQLAMLGFQVGQFRHSVGLLEHCEALPSQKEDRHAAANWANIAAYHAAFCVYHFRSTLLSIRERVGNCPRFSRRVAKKRVQNAIDQFEVEFPDWRGLRDGVGHMADRMFKPSDFDDHALEDGTWYLGLLVRRTLTHTHNKKLVELDVDYPTLDRLIAIKNETYEAFRKAPLRQPLD